MVDVNPAYNTLDRSAPIGLQGCFVDGFLKNATFRSGSMTIEMCNNYCGGLGYPYAGTEYGTNCFCGSADSVPENLAPASNCYAACYGNSSESCGGNGVMSIYKLESSLAFAIPNTDAGKTVSSSNDIFTALSVTSPASIFPQRSHFILPMGINSSLPIHTNKQYSQAFYGTQHQILTMIPYIVNWIGNAFAVQHSDASQYSVSGTATNGKGASAYGGPLAQQQITFSATELYFASAPCMVADSSLHASVNLNLSPSEGSPAKLTMPLVNGMGLVTAQYRALNPVIMSPNVKISSFSYVAAPGHSGIAQKLRLQLGDASVWVLYLIPNAGSSSNLIFSRNATNPNSLVADALWSGTIQTAKITTVSDPVQGEATLDAAAGTWVTSMSLAGSTSGQSGSYSFKYQKAGDTTKSPLIFALPHHLEVLQRIGTTGLLMQSPITGVAEGFLADTLTMNEPDLPTNVGFMSSTGEANWSNSTLFAIKKAITPDILSGSAENCDQYSTYSSGKCLAKWSQLCMVAQDIIQDASLTKLCVAQLVTVYNRFATNTQHQDLTYETTWKGLVASAGFSDATADFGATTYNDHHFHYSYVIYAAAVLGYLDPAWLTTANVEWVNTLVRDVANPSPADPFFPQFRNMDWYIGHGVAHGIKDDSASGKDQESSSEDYNFSYGLKLWGHVTGNADLEGLGNMMCAVNMRSMNNYILLGPDNKNVPLAYAQNYANGVTYANSMGYFTYFGAQVQYVNGIHMLPLTPISPYVRTAKFVQGEWDSLLAPLHDEIWNTGWAGILYSDLAISDPGTSWDFFNNGSVVDFNFYNLDDGQSLTWALTFAAGLGGGT